MSVPGSVLAPVNNRLPAPHTPCPDRSGLPVVSGGRLYVPTGTGAGAPHSPACLPSPYTNVLCRTLDESDENSQSRKNLNYTISLELIHSIQKVGGGSGK